MNYIRLKKKGTKRILVTFSTVRVDEVFQRCTRKWFSSYPASRGRKIMVSDIPLPLLYTHISRKTTRRWTRGRARQRGKGRGENKMMDRDEKLARWDERGFTASSGVPGGRRRRRRQRKRRRTRRKKRKRNKRGDGKPGRNERGRGGTPIFPRAGFWNLFERFEI